jgi:uncharacterized membrane protein
MTLLIIGVALWSVTHLFPALAPTARQGLVARLGEKAYKGGFALLIVAALALIIMGWKTAPPATVSDFLYAPPAWGRHVTALLVLIAFILFGASHGANNIARRIRHPQLTAVLLWGAGHLIANGETRSVVLFGGLVAWSIVSIVLINRREGPRVRPDPAPLRKDVIAIVAGLVVYVIFAGAHQWLFGVSPFV